MDAIHFIRRDDSPLSYVGKEEIGTNPKRIYFNPFAYALTTESFKKYCWSCLEDIENKPKVKCESCNVARYCRNVCREKGKMDHKVECKGLKTHNFLSVEARFLARIVVRVKDIRSGEDKSIPHFYENRSSKRNVEDLWHNKEYVEMDKYAMEKFDRIWTEVTTYCSEKYLLSREDAFELHCRSISNRHTICDNTYTMEIGKGLYLDLSKYNHSCRPNAVYYSNGTRMALVGLHDKVNVEDTENTFYSYISLTDCTPVRRKLLADSWYFLCECERCVDVNDDFCTSVYCPKCIQSVPEPGEGDLVKIKYTSVKIFNRAEPSEYNAKCSSCHYKLPKDYIDKALKNMRKLNHVLDTLEDATPENSVEQFKFLIDVTTKFAETFTLSNSYMCNIIAKLINIVQLVSSNTELQLKLFEMTDTYCRYTFRYAHPSKAKLCLYVAQLYVALNKIDEAIKLTEEGKAISEYVFGKKHSCYKEAKKQLHELKELNQPRHSEAEQNDDHKPDGTTVLSRAKYIARQVAIRRMSLYEPPEEKKEDSHSDSEMYDLVED